MTSKGCGTCRDRKVLCDRAAPTCKRCSRSGLKCLGYGMRLSWPRERDTRRAILGKLLTESTRARKVTHASLVNTTTWDFEMREYLSKLGSQDRSHLTPPTLPVCISWSPFRMNTQQKDLLQYFESIASHSLIIFGHDLTDVRRVLLRMALSDNTASTTAVMKSLLALSSLHRFGPQSEAAQLKIGALQALGASLKTNIGEKEGIQHVAAGMLLCCFEIQETSATSGQWLLYICGAKDIIGAVKLFERYTRNADHHAILDWVYYHDAMSRFSLRHWRRHPTIEAAYDAGIRMSNLHQPLRCARIQAPPREGIPWGHRLLSLLSETCDSILDPSDPVHKTDNHKSLLKLIHWELTEIPIPDMGDVPQTDVRASMANMGELYRLAGLVYLERATEGLVQFQPGVSQWVEKAFDIFSRLDACEWPFPLFIFASEARTDEQRIALLELIDKTEKSNAVRNLGPVLSMIRSMWAQDDLAEEAINYVDKLSVLVSSSRILPTFV